MILDGLLIRDFAASDAEGVSELFVAVYQDRYVYPEVYLPSAIVRAVLEQRWFSAVAYAGGRIVGHAALVPGVENRATAELALNAVHPDWRGRGIATALGRHLCAWARHQRRFDYLTIKQVCAHVQSQRMARTLGFQTTGLLLDYVNSPFGGAERETIVVGCLRLDARPVPWSHEVGDWLSCAAPGAARQGLPTLALCDGRLDVNLHSVDGDTLREVRRLPRTRLTHLSLPLAQNARDAVIALQRYGFASAGAMPEGRGQWRWLMQRGFCARSLDLQCPRAQDLYARMCVQARVTENNLT